STVNVYYDLNSLDGDQWTPILPVSSKGLSGTSGADSLSWDLPSTVTNTARIRIEDAADAANTYSIGADFKIGAEFDITYPENGQVVYAEDTTTDIDWDTDRGTAINKVKLYYSNNSEDATPIWIEITPAGGVANTGSYPWNPVPRELTDIETTTHRIKITQFDPPNEDNVFNIGEGGTFPILGTLEVTTPSTGSESWNIGTAYDIKFKKQGDLQSADVYYSYDGTAPNYVKINVTPVDISDATGVKDGGDNYTFSWTPEETTTLTTGFSGKIKVKAVTPGTQTSVEDEQSNSIEVKGALTLLTPSLTNISMAVGNNYLITWSKFGLINNVELHYSTDGGIIGGGSYPGGQLIASVPSQPSSFLWPVDDTIGDNVRVRVRDTNNSNVWDESDNAFTIIGKIKVDKPDLIEPDWIVGQPVEIRWTPTGTFPLVMIEGSTDGFATENNNFPITTVFAGATGAQQLYNYPSVGDQISDQVKIRVSDSRPAYAALGATDVSDNEFNIKGRVQVTQPVLDQELNIDTAATLEWQTWGSINFVKVQYSTDGLAWSDIDAMYPNNPGLLTDLIWTPTDSNDVTTTGYIRVTDAFDGNVSDDSEKFIINGWFEFDSVGNGDTPADGDRWEVGPAVPHTIKWTKHGNIPLVNLEYSPNSANYYTIQNNVANTGSYAWNPDPATTLLSAGKTARIKVSESGNLVNYAISDAYRLIGKITLLNPLGGESYSFGDSETIRWQVTGQINNVHIAFSAEGDLSDYEEIITTSTPSGGGSITTFPWDIDGPSSTDVVLRVADALDFSVNAITDEFDPIRIQVVYTIDSPSNGQVWAVDSTQLIEWTTLLGTSPQVKLEVWDGAAWVAFDAPGDGVIANNINEEVSWVVPDYIQDSSQIRISDPRDYPGSAQVMDTTNDTPTVTEEYFKIRGDLVITQPNTAVAWNTGSSHDITFTTAGSIAAVKLEYSIVGGGIGNYPPTLPDNPIATGVVPNVGATTTVPWSIPDVLTIQARVKVTDESDSVVYDESDVDFTIQAILSFDAGTFTAGEDLLIFDAVINPVMKTINWDTVGPITNIKLEYSIDNGVYQTISGAGSLDASLGTFNWVVPDDINTIADTMKVKISSADPVSEPALEAVSPGMNIKGVLALSEPSAILYVDDSCTISWRRSGSISNVKLQYIVDGGIPIDIAGAGNIDISGAGPIYTFDWDVPNQISDDVVIRIVDLLDTSVYDDTNPVRIAGALDLISPNGGVGIYYEVDSNCPVSWQVHGAIANVELSYDTNSGLNGYLNVITTRAATPSAWSWPTADAIGTAVRLKVADADGAAFTRADASDNDFEIRGNLTITSPGNGDVWFITATDTPITWTKNGSISTVKLEISIDGLPYETVSGGGAVDTSGAGPFTFNWTVPDKQSAQAKIKVTDLADVTGNTYDESDGFFTIRTGFVWQNPEVAPPGGMTVLTVEDSIVLQWQTFGTVATARIWYSTNLGASWKDLKTGAAITNQLTDGTPIINDGSESWIVPDDMAATIYLRIMDHADVNAYAELQNVRIQGELTIEKPDSSTIWLAGQAGRIEWSMKGSINALKIEYSKDGGLNFTPPNGDIIYGSATAANLFIEWDPIPEDAITPTAVIRITDVDNADVTDSYGNFPIKASFTVITPANTDTWVVDDVEDISWTTIGAVSEVNLYYYNESVSDWVLINAEGQYTNDSSGVTEYPWTVADSISDIVKVRVVDANDVTAIAESLEFKIRGRLTITEPSDGYLVDPTEIWEVAGEHNILWDRQGSVDQVYLDYHDGTVWQAILEGGTPEIGNDGGFTWTVPDNLTDQAIIRITAVGYPDITDESDAFFKIVGGFDVTDPAPGSFENAGDMSVPIRWTSTSSNIPNVKIDCSLDGGSNFLYNITNSWLNSSELYPWDIPASMVSGAVVVRISDATEPDAYGDSGVFRIRAVLQLTSPNEGDEAFVIGRSNPITWLCTGDIPQVLLEYTTTGNFATDRRTIGNVDNDGSYDWIVPDDNNISEDIYLRAADPDDYEARDDSDNKFKIIAGFDLTYPVGGEDWDVNSQPTITWTCTSVSVTNVKIAYSMNGGGTWEPDITLTANDGSFQWTSGVDDTAITTEAKIKVYDAAYPEAFGESPSDFNIRADFDLVYPNGSEVFSVGENVDIAWNYFGVVDKVDLSYSTDGSVWNPIVSGVNNADNASLGVVDGSYSWTVADDISDTVKVRVSDADIGHPAGWDDSDADFRIKGDLWVKAPVLDESWAIGQNYDITWGWQGTMPEVMIEYSVNGAAGPFNPIVENEGTTADDGIVDNDAGSGGVASEATYSWIVPDEAASDVIIRITDPRSGQTDVTDDSASFHIVGYLLVKAPTSVDKLTVTYDYDITWEWGGTMPEVEITYSVNGAAGPFNPIIENEGTTADDGIVDNDAGGGGVGSEATYTWVVPDDISDDCIIRITDTRDSTVYSDTDEFSITGEIIVTAPNGAERWIAREPDHDITWITNGTIDNVEILYSTDDFVSDTNTVVSSVANDNKYNWNIPDDRSETVKVRVLDADDNSVYDDSDAVFEIDYFRVDWDIRDLMTNENLSEMAVEMTSGTNTADNFGTDNHPQVAGSPLATPCYFEMPYGAWTAVWSKTAYGDKQYTFMLNQDMTIETLFMETTVIHIWRAYSEFTYEADSDTLKATSWLERDGYVVSGAVTDDIYIYDDTGALIEEVTRTYLDEDLVEQTVNCTMLSGSPNPAGFFNLVWNNCGLQESKVYSVITIITNASGALFKTPTSFSITETKQLKATQDAMVLSSAEIENMTTVTIPQFQSDVEDTITAGVAVQTAAINVGMAAQKATIEEAMADQKETIEDGIASQEDMIDDKMAEQTQMIDDKTEEMKDSMDETLTSFETRTEETIEQLQAGADTAIAAGEELETIAKRQSGELILPTSVLLGDMVEIRYRNESKLMPLMDIITYDGTMVLNGQPIMESGVTAGLYGYDLLTDGDTFKAGKAVTVVVREVKTGNLEAGSFMVEATSLTSIEGLLSLTPQMREDVKQALQGIQAVEGTLATGGDVGRALTTLQTTLDDLPEVLAEEVFSEDGAGGQMIDSMNKMVERLIGLASDEGYDISELIEEALSKSPTIIEIRQKTEKIKSAVKFLQALFEHKLGGMEDEPIVSTSLSSGSVVLNVVAANPSSVKPQKTKVKVYLPKEVTPKDIMDTGGLEVEFDANKSIYYVYKNDIMLEPKAVKVYKVEIEDIWMIADSTLDILKLRALKLKEAFEKTEYEVKVGELAESITQRLDEIAASQENANISRERHIGSYRTNIKEIERIKEELLDTEKLVVQKPGDVGALTKEMTWKIILTVLVFMALLAGVFFFTWHRQAGATKETLDKAKQFAFPGEENKEIKEEQKKQE
ncbi:MAG: apolipoprotein A1/A4/E family protein, partial [PVC group bacterium]|nr:apolipoprotein A1/A4/E family protein [PVC group bacterium]